MDSLITASIRAADLLRHIQSSSGDLPLRTLHELHDALRAAGAGLTRTIIEGDRARAAAERHMVDLGGPATLSELATAGEDVRTKAAAFNAKLRTVLTSMDQADLVSVTALDDGWGGTAATILWGSFIPAALADPFRMSNEVTELRASFESMGA